MVIRKLREYLERNSIGILWVSAQMGISYRALLRVMDDGDFNMSTVDKICDYLDCQPGDLFEVKK